jgi:hypothetical protein
MLDHEYYQAPGKDFLSFSARQSDALQKLPALAARLGVDPVPQGERASRYLIGTRSNNLYMTCST